MEPTAPSTPTPKRKTPLLPDGDRGLATLGLLVAKYWASQPWLTLRFCTAAEFLAKATAYEAAVTSRQQAGSARPIEADELLDLDHLIETTLYRVKSRLTDKYDKKKAPAHYPTVGIIKQGKDYILDGNRPKRAAALLMLAKGLKTEGIDDGAYGTAFWQPIADRYNELVKRLADTSGTISQAVATKDTQRTFVEQVLSSLAKVLDANYPNDPEYKAELRAAGFQRETY